MTVWKPCLKRLCVYETLYGTKVNVEPCLKRWKESVYEIKVYVEPCLKLKWMSNPVLNGKK